MFSFFKKKYSDLTGANVKLGSSISVTPMTETYKFLVDKKEVVNTDYVTKGNMGPFRIVDIIRQGGKPAYKLSMLDADGQIKYLNISVTLFEMLFKKRRGK